MSTRPPVTGCRAVVRKAHHARPGNAGGRRLYYCHVSGAGHDGDTYIEVGDTHGQVESTGRNDRRGSFPGNSCRCAYRVRVPPFMRLSVLGFVGRDGKIRVLTAG